ncbi:MAG: PAS domain S-box protein [Chloroflexi bacterium]|nr:PAS domain S-box protein [Chloroflexota bacterium]
MRRWIVRPETRTLWLSLIIPALLLVVVNAGVLAPVLIVSAQQEAEAQLRLRGLGVLSTVQTQWQERQQHLATIARLLAADAPLWQPAASGDWTAVAEHLQAARERLDLDYVVIDTPAARHVFAAGVPAGQALPATTAPPSPALVGLLEGEPVILAEAPLPDLGGVLLVGRRIAPPELAVRRERTGVDVLLLQADRVLAPPDVEPTVLELARATLPLPNGVERLRTELARHDLRPIELVLAPDTALIALVPMAEVERVVRERGLVLLAGLVMLALSLLVARGLFIRDIARPVQAMAKVSRDLVQGRYDSRVPHSPVHELHQVGVALNHLAEQLAVEIAERRQSEAQFRAAFEHAAVGMALLALDGRWLRVNPALCELLARPAATLLTTTNAALTHPDDLAAERPLLAELLAGHRRAYQLEKRYRRPDGSEVWVLASASVVRDSEERPLYLIGQFQDITGRKEAEATLREREEQLRHAAKMEAIGRLAGGVAHDFNNLLTVIHGFGELLQAELEPDDPHRSHVVEILQASERAAALTHQLLAFSRRQMLQPEVLDLNDVVLEMDQMLRRVLGEDITLTTVRRAGLGHVRADRRQLEQVLLNLAINARDAMPQGGKLTIETANVELDAEYVQRHITVSPGSYVMLAVSDTGCGMDAETQAHIFEPFFTTKEPGKGTGLGLAMVYGIVKQSGGYIWVYSEVGRGTTFKIYLPRVQAVAAATPRQPMVRPLPPQGRETILLVEDEPQVRTLARIVLEGCGYTVLAASCGAEATRLATEHCGPIHLLLTDVVMPGMSGRELARTLAAHGQPVRVLYMSGYTNDAIVQHGVLDDEFTLLQKPFTPDALAWAVRRALDASPVASPAVSR